MVQRKTAPLDATLFFFLLPFVYDAAAAAFLPRTISTKQQSLVSRKRAALVYSRPEFSCSLASARKIEDDTNARRFIPPDANYSPFSFSLHARVLYRAKYTTSLRSFARMKHAKFPVQIVQSGELTCSLMPRVSGLVPGRHRDVRVRVSLTRSAASARYTRVTLFEEQDCHRN